MVDNKNAKKRKIILIVTAVIMIAVSFFCGFFVRSCTLSKDERVFSEIADYLKRYGVFDSETLELKDLTAEELANILIGNLPDDYATYYTPEEYKKLKENGDGNYSGIGIVVEETTGGLQVRNISLNAPAFHAGILEGDIIYKCEKAGEIKDVLTISDFTSYVSALNESEKFTLYCKRGENFVSFEVSKEKYVTSYVYYKDSEKSAYLLSEEFGKDPVLTERQEGLSALSKDTAYIKLTSFEGNAASEIGLMLDYMEERGKSKLILDLRDNGGGYMSVLSDVCAHFIGRGASPMAYSKDNKGDYTSFYSSSNKTPKHVTEFAVIANENTASASECLIGAMLYYKYRFDINNLIIENQETTGSCHTFGKGIMQTTYNLSNGGGIKLTTAIIYQPDKSTCIHGSGVVVSGNNAVKKADGIAIERANAILST